MRRTAVMVAVVLFLLPGAHRAFAGLSPDGFQCGMTVTADFTFSGNHACPGAVTAMTAIGDVTIDLSGFTLSGDSTPTSNGVFANGNTHLSVVNGTINGFDVGINFNGGKKLRVSQMTFGNNHTSGIFSAAKRFLADHVTATGSHNEGVNLVSTKKGSIEITDSEFSHNDQYGLYAAGGSMIIRRLVANDNEIGATLANGRSAKIADSTFSSNLTGAGLIVANVGDVRVTDSHVNGNGNDGITVTRSGQTVIDGNEASSNGASDDIGELGGMGGGLGINVYDHNGRPTGKNIAVDNVNADQCHPKRLCPGAG